MSVTSTAGVEPQLTVGAPVRARGARLAGAPRSTLRLAALTLAIGLIITGVLTGLSRTVYVHNELRLLRLRVHDAAALVTTALTGVQTPMASVAELADATGGSAAKFRAFAAPYAGPRGEFASLSIWDLRDPGRGPIAVAGVAPQLMHDPGAINGFFAQVGHSIKLSVIGLLSSSQPRLGYGYSTPGPSHYVAYAEAALPRNRYSPVQKGSPFAGMRYALYLQRAEPSKLLATDVHNLPLSGVTQRVPFGDSAFVLTMAASGPLSGTLPRALPWIIAIGGLLLSLAAAAAVLRLAQGRLGAEALAGELETVARENRRLYAEQRGIAQTLQHALLPDVLPQVAGVQAAGQYEAGESSIDIGGDWYDVVALEDGSLLLVVGDVSGRGLTAATTMASLRFAIHAYAAEERRPERILEKLSGVLSLTSSRQLATALCARIEPDSRRVTVASAGHLPPLVLSGHETHYLDPPVGVPIGVDGAPRYSAVTVELPPHATLLAFTDGLVERRGERLDVGLERLRQAALGMEATLPELLSKLVAELSAGEAKDDIAIVGLRWTN